MDNEAMRNKFQGVFCEDFRKQFKEHIANCPACKSSLQDTFSFLLKEFPILSFILKKMGINFEELMTHD